MNGHDRIVVGASLGGLDALQRLLSQLPADFPAAVFVVQHTAAQGPGLLAGILDRVCPMQVRPALDGDEIVNGRIYVAQPDRHLLVNEGRIRTPRGPKENNSRPAVDPLFRSAAACYGPRVVGIILTGRLDDGSAGLLAVKRCNGVTMVQEPGDAFCDEMPRNALEAAEPVDYQLAVAEMGPRLKALAEKPAGERVPVPGDIRLEVRMAERTDSLIKGEKSLGSLVPIACPECGGPLWQKDESRLQYFRCHVGHAFTALTLLAKQNEEVERSLWMTLRSLEEQENLMTRMANDAARRGRDRSAGLFSERMPEIRQAADEIRRLLAG